MVRIIFIAVLLARVISVAVIVTRDTVMIDAVRIYVAAHGGSSLLFESPSRFSPGR